MSILSELQSFLPGDDSQTVEDAWEALRHRITVLSARVWEGRNEWPTIQRWLNNFNGSTGFTVETERLHALFLLSEFLYIGSIETRVLQRALYRDLFAVPLLQELKQVSGVQTLSDLSNAYNDALGRTRFLGVGNPSESGVHLLYYFRQENSLRRQNFMDGSGIFAYVMGADGQLGLALADPIIERYVFVDDVCGSGETVITKTEPLLKALHALKPEAKVSYFAMFATHTGLKNVRDNSSFGNYADAVFELDESFKCLSQQSRYLREPPPHINRTVVEKIVLEYGLKLIPKHPDGYEGCQLLLGFHHNTPDNTIPIIWAEGRNGMEWTPAFRRYPKLT